jgi:hypothetical protein
MCRAAKDVCDAVEMCDGFSTECPADNPAPLGKPCDDSLFCTGQDSCDGKGTCSHTGDPCADNQVCSDVCDDENDTCLVPDGTACDDNLAWTADTSCLDGVCVGTETEGNCEKPYELEDLPFSMKGNINGHESHISKYGKKCAIKALETADVVYHLFAEKGYAYRIEVQGREGSDALLIMSETCEEESSCQQFKNDWKEDGLEVITFDGDDADHYIVVEVSSGSGLFELRGKQMPLDADVSSSKSSGGCSVILF